MIAPELKPCPFCGGAPEIDFGLLHAPREVGRQFISCPTVTCGAYAYGADAWNIRADLAPAAPKVKALVWKWHRDPRDTSEARTTIGSWTIWEIDGSGYCHGPNDTSGKWCKGGLDGAKAAAQADYEARILAALEGGDG